MAKSSTQTVATKKKRVFAAIAVGLFILAAIAAVVIYRRIAPARAVQRAQALLESGDFRNASLSAQRALRLDGANPAACRIMAELLERTNQPQQALAWRHRVCELAPQSLPDTLAWVECALRADQPREARRALETVREADRDDVRVLASAGALAVAVEQFDVANRHYARALQLKPDDERLQFNYAVTALRTGNAEQARAALAQLEQLAQRPAWRVLALRSLVSDAIAHRRWSMAMNQGRELVSEPQATFKDCLLYLDVLHRAGDRDRAETYLARLQNEASQRPVEVGLLIAWLTETGLAAKAVAWANALPKAVTAAAPAGAALAAAFVEVKDWAGLQALVAPVRWGPLEHLRLAFLTRSLREQGQPEAATVQWQAAVAEATRPGHSLLPLTQLALAWGWEAEANDLLRRLGESPREMLSGLQLAYRQFATRGDTPGLLRIAERILAIDPNNDAARNNVAMLSLLLQTDLPNAIATAEKLYTKAKDNAVFASTYGYALYIQQRPGEALQVMNALRPDQLEEPSNALYYALFLAADGNREKARRFIEIARTAKLLPEEKVLLDQTSRRLAQ